MKSPPKVNHEIVTAPIFNSSEFPMSTERLNEFEKLNGNKFNVRVLGFSKDGIYPIRVTENVNSHAHHVHVSSLKICQYIILKNLFLTF